ncbi:MAG: hypothetical protein R6U37_08675 [Dehalococcoidia bacterium]
MAKKKPEQKPEKIPRQKLSEAETTTVSVRITRYLRERIRVVQEKRGESIAGLFLECLDALGKNMYKEQIVYVKAYKKGYAEGYDAAKKRFGIPFPCHACGELAYVEKPEDKAFLSEAVEGFEDWTHVICPTKEVTRGKDEHGDKAAQ